MNICRGKAATVTGLVLAGGIVAVLASVLAGQLILPGRGIDPAHGYASLSFGSAAVLRRSSPRSRAARRWAAISSRSAR